ncbi:hypothetical protein D3C73_1158660 [compost metagenome]
MQVVRHPHPPPEPLQQRIIGDIRFLAAGKEHPYAGEDQEACEKVQHPVIAGDQRRTAADHDRPQDDDAEHAPEQHAMLIKPGHGKGAEDQGDDEDIVHRQAFLDSIGGQVVDRAVGPQPRPQPRPESQGHGDVEGGEPQAFPYADFMIAPIEQPQIQRQQADDDRQEACPHPDGLAQPLQQQQFHRRLREPFQTTRPTSR